MKVVIILFSFVSLPCNSKWPHDTGKWAWWWFPEMIRGKKKTKTQIKREESFSAYLFLPVRNTCDDTMPGAVAANLQPWIWKKKKSEKLVEALILAGCHQKWTACFQISCYVTIGCLYHISLCWSGSLLLESGRILTDAAVLVLVVEARCPPCRWVSVIATVMQPRGHMA